MASRLIILLLLLPNAALYAQTWPACDHAQVHLYLYTDNPRVVSESYRNRIREKVVAMLRLQVGARMQIKAIAIPEMDDWLDQHSLAELTPARCRSSGCHETEKTLLVVIRYQLGTYELSAAEYDPQFDHFGPRLTRQVVQRELVPDTVARLSARAWCPWGVIIGRTQARYQLQFRDLARLRQAPDWSRLKTGDALQICRQLVSDNGIQLQTHPDQFLLVRDVTSQGVMAEPAYPSEQTRWFELLGDARVRYLVRRVDGEPAPLQVRVLLLESNQPREGCEVHVAAGMPAGPEDVGERKGITDESGQLEFSTQLRPLLFVSVFYDDILATKVYAHGVSEQPLTFLMPYRGGERVEFVMALDRLLDEKRNRVIEINHLQEQLEAAQRRGDSAEVAGIVERISRHFDVTSMRERATTIARLAETRKIDIAENAASVIKQLDDLAHQRNSEGYAEIDQIARNKKLELQIESARQAGDWETVARLLEQFCRLNPDKTDAAERLRKLQAAFRVQAPEQERARKIARQGIAIARIDDLLLRWDDLYSAIEVLLRYKDRLVLQSVAERYDEWLTMVGNEANRIKQIADSGPLRDQNRAQTLQARKTLLERITRDLSQAVQKTDRILDQGLFSE